MILPFFGEASKTNVEGGEGLHFHPFLFLFFFYIYPKMACFC